MLTQLLSSFKTKGGLSGLSFEAGQKLKKALRSILQGVLKNSRLCRDDYLQLAYGLLSGKLLTVKAFKGLDELAFGLLHAAANPGSNDSPLSYEEASPFFQFIYQVCYQDFYIFK